MPTDPCEGESLDFDVLVSACSVLEKPAPLPAGISVRVEPAKLEVGSGGHVDFSVVFANGGQAPATFVVDVACGGFEVGAYDQRGNRADVISSASCSHGSSCSGGPVQVTLPPGGTLKKRLGFRAAVRKVGGPGCMSVSE